MKQQTTENTDNTKSTVRITMSTFKSEQSGPITDSISTVISKPSKRELQQTEMCLKVLWLLLDKQVFGDVSKNVIVVLRIRLPIFFFHFIFEFRKLSSN